MCLSQGDVVCVCVLLPVSPTGQCEQCLCWQHADCVGIDEEQPPEHYLCCICQSPLGMSLTYTIHADKTTYMIHYTMSIILICIYPALRKNAKYKVSIKICAILMSLLCTKQFDRSWYRDGKLPSVMGGVPFAHSSDVITSHEISSSLTNLSQCLHSLEQLLSVAG